MADVVAESWWHGASASAFQNGSMVIEDDTLSFSGGSSVNLRVKLSTRPRANVVVGLSETSDLIFLGSSSLTFTSNNWGIYQNVLVSSFGGQTSQTIPLPSSAYNTRLNINEWDYPRGSRPAIDSSLLPTSTTRYFRSIEINESAHINPGRVGLFIENQNSEGQYDLTDNFENYGSLTIESGGNTLTVRLAGADTEEPYTWQPSNSAEAAAFSDGISTTSGTLTIRDYSTGTATIALAASGPPEFAGKTDSVTVTVG